jgi:ethanolamine transporter EutH
MEVTMGKHEVGALTLAVLGIAALVPVLFTMGTLWGWPCAVFGGAVNGWCAGKLWFGRW